MAAPSSTTSSSSKSNRRQALIWLMMTLLLGVATALLWMVSQTPAIGAKIENAPIAAPEALVSELEQPLSIESLHELDNDIQPIDFEDTIRDLRNYPDEFKDKRYLLANKGKWTVQVMNVAENEVIVSYLEGRKDRDKFAYFRYRDENKQLRYMLTYGLLNSSQEAVGAAKLVDFGLPADVRVLSEEINRYTSIIDNYERSQPIKDLSTRRSRSVKLNPTKREVPVRQKAPVVPKVSNDNEEATSKPSSNQSNTNSTGSISQSADTSDTLSVNEERTLSSENSDDSKNDDKAIKAEPQVKKPPVVATPKQPSSASNPDKASEGSNKKNNSSADKSTTNKGNSDPIKQLIEEKSK
ncbi:hypothetical protein KPY62_10260 [Psychrobacter sp. TAE2020]|uniref:hypothetical protein n=1 Tax=Psychrobacter sp. TAE2020 TaxID=2846762 RepID=UPI001C103F6F|nr:hypothetical protein [Psychrobacter sp. TAE2020]MBU5617466.1 hypothetical protein [Psychrobacter sp. TAE2020]